MTKDEKKPESPKSTPVIHEPETDEYSEYKKDPRLDTQVYKKTFTHPPYAENDLLKKVITLDDDEAFLDELRIYKRQQHKEIIDTLESKPLKNRHEILTRLSNVADTIITAAYAHIAKNMEEIYGLPSFLSSYKQTQVAHLAIVGMGKLGARKINYHSDLDIIFVYSQRGETHGKKVIDNAEYFVKLAQKFITALSVMTAAGRCYEIDTELRPSGNLGTLVTSYDHFIEHQMNRAQNWERQALVRARSLSDHYEFQKLLDDQIQKLAFERPLPPDFTKNMHQIRERVLKERCKESENKIDIKLGPGSLMDIEFILHNIQLKNANVFPDLRQHSLFDLLNILKNHDFLSKKELQTFTEAHLYYRTIESLLQLIKNRSDSVVDFASETFEEICARLNMNTKELQEKILHFRKEIRNIYKRIYIS